MPNSLHVVIHLLAQCVVQNKAVRVRLIKHHEGA